MSDDSNLEERQQFADTKALREGVGRKFAAEGRSFKASKNSGGKQKIYICSGADGGCKAEVRAFKIAAGEWRISKVVGEHINCSGGKTTGRSAAFQHVAEEAIRDNAKVSGVDLKRKMETGSGVKMGQRSVNRMKNAAQKAIMASLAGSYQQLPSLCLQLEAGSPGTVAEVERNSDGTFRRMFTMLGRPAHACAHSPFKILCVDAGHLKGDWNGVMMLVTCKDANNTLVHVATAICDKENGDNYKWLYSRMRKNADMEGVLDSPETTIYTDQHLSHAPAINSMAKNCQWRWCLRHMIGKLDQKVGETVNNWLYHAARAPTYNAFIAIMDKEVLPFKPLAYAAMMAHPRERWTHHAGPEDTVIADQTTSNPVEQNMNMVGPEARKLPPYGLMMSIVDKTALRCSQKADLRRQTPEKLTPSAAKTFEAQRKKSANLHVIPTGNGNFSVRKAGSNYGNRVVLKLGTGDAETEVDCTCKFIVRFKIPCCDIIAVGRHLNKADEVMSLVDSAFLLETYRGLYADAEFQIQLPVPGELTVDPTLLPPLMVDGQGGRPRKTKGPTSTRRLKSAGEHSASSAFNVRLTPRPGTTPTVAGLAQGGGGQAQGGGGQPQGAPPSLSQGAPGLSQGAPGLSQGAPGLSQGAPGLSQSGTINVVD